MIMKSTTDIQWVSTPTRQRRVVSRKRTLRSCSVRVARSVWSENQSRGIESRKLDDRWGLPESCKGGQHHGGCLTTKSIVARPGSETRAEVYWDIQGTWESLISPHRQSYRSRVPPVEQDPGAAQTSPCCSTKRREGSERASNFTDRRRFWEMESGSLSGLIMTVESRETLPGRSL